MSTIKLTGILSVEVPVENPEIQIHEFKQKNADVIAGILPKEECTSIEITVNYNPALNTYELISIHVTKRCAPIPAIIHIDVTQLFHEYNIDSILAEKIDWLSIYKIHQLEKK